MWTMERVKGIEPSYAAWEAAVLPLNYTRVPKILIVHGIGFKCIPFARPKASAISNDHLLLSVDGRNALVDTIVRIL